MKKLFFILLAVFLLTWSAAAQTSAQSQTSTSATTNTEVGVKGSGVQAQSNTNASADQQTEVSRQNTDKNKGAKTSSTTDASANQSASASASGNSANSSMNTVGTLNAVLTHSVDARHAKEGQEVSAKTTSALRTAEGTEIPKGAKLIGHVTSAKARAKGDAESSLAIVFDKAQLKGGQDVPLHAIIQGLSAPAAPAAMNMSDDMHTSASAGMGPQGSTGGAMPTNRNGGVVGAATGTVNNTVGAVGNTTAGVAGQAGQTVGNVGATTTGTVNSTAGVSGLPGLSLHSEASNATQGSVISSTGKDVKLDSGTQMVLRVLSQ